MNKILNLAILAVCYLNAVVGNDPIYLVGTISVNDDTISEQRPCGLGGQFSFVAGKRPTIFQKVMAALVPNSIEFEMRHRYLCGWPLDEKASFGRFNVQCYRRRLFGGCSPLSTLHLHDTSIVNDQSIADTKLPRSNKICNSRTVTVDEEEYRRSRSAIFNSSDSADNTIKYNISESHEQKVWQFQDGNSAKHFSTQFLHDADQVSFFGDSVDDLIANHSSRFVVYVCRGLVIPLIKTVTTTTTTSSGSTAVEAVEATNKAEELMPFFPFQALPSRASGEKTAIKHRKATKIEIIYVIVLSFFTCCTTLVITWKLIDYYRRRRRSEASRLNISVNSDDLTLHFSPLHDVNGGANNSTPSTIISAFATESARQANQLPEPPSYDELMKQQP